MEFTPRGIAKSALSSIVAAKTAQQTKQAITDYTQFDDDDIIVNVTGGLVGAYVAHRLKPVTDKIVDKTADFVVTVKDKKFTKKTETTES